MDGTAIIVKNAKVVKISKKPALVDEEVNTPIDVILQDPIHGKIFCSVRQAWGSTVGIGDSVSAKMIVQKRGFENDPLLVSKKISNVKVANGR